jgi:hypothetical protein
MVRIQEDDNFRSVSLVLALLCGLAILSFVMAGVVGAREKPAAPAQAAIHGATYAAAISAPARLSP